MRTCVLADTTRTSVGGVRLLDERMSEVSACLAAAATSGDSTDVSCAPPASVRPPSCNARRSSTVLSGETHTPAVLVLPMRIANEKGEVFGLSTKHSKFVAHLPKESQAPPHCSPSTRITSSTGAGGHTKAEAPPARKRASISWAKLFVFLDGRVVVVLLQHHQDEQLPAAKLPGRQAAESASKSSSSSGCGSQNHHVLQ